MTTAEKIQKAQGLRTELKSLHDEILKDSETTFYAKHFAPNDIIEYRGNRMKIHIVKFKINDKSESEIRKVYAFKFKKNGEPFANSTKLYIWSLNDIGNIKVIEKAPQL